MKIRNNRNNTLNHHRTAQQLAGLHNSLRYQKKAAHKEARQNARAMVRNALEEI
jgi:hypothetical protein